MAEPGLPKGGSDQVRAGTGALSVLATPLNVQILQALEEGPVPLIDLRKAAGAPPQTTLRASLRNLAKTGLIERRQEHKFPGVVDCELRRAGQELLAVAGVVDRWLAEAPDGPLALGSTVAKSAIKALVGGWSSGMIRALAAKPFSLTELSRLIGSLNYPSLERRLGALRLAGLVEACERNGSGTPYRPTGWLHRAVGPLMAAALWERERLPDATPALGRMDVEAAFLLAVPGIRLPESRSGVCRLAAEIRSAGGESTYAGVVVAVEDGRVASCVSRLEGGADAWAVGSPQAWLRATVEEETHLLELGGETGLAHSLLAAIRDATFPAKTPV